jgi:transcription elongation factor
MKRKELESKLHELERRLFNLEHPAKFKKGDKIEFRYMNREWIKGTIMKNSFISSVPIMNIISYTRYYQIIDDNLVFACIDENNIKLLDKRKNGIIFY